MAFYRHKATYEDLTPYIAELQKYIRLNLPVVPRDEIEDRGWTETFLCTLDQQREMMKRFQEGWGALTWGGYLDMTPGLQKYRLLYWRDSVKGPHPTVAPEHIRLPKLSYLITLTPEDFFTTMKLIATARPTQTKDSLSLNPPAAGIQDFNAHNVALFFSLVRVNYRINPEYADKKWTPRDAITKVANLHPTRDNQLSAMQYLTALQNSDLLYFPAATVIELELDWEQVSDEYCVPPDTTTLPFTNNSEMIEENRREIAWADEQKRLEEFRRQRGF